MGEPHRYDCPGKTIERWNDASHSYFRYRCECGWFCWMRIYHI